MTYRPHNDCQRRTGAQRWHRERGLPLVPRAPSYCDSEQARVELRQRAVGVTAALRPRLPAHYFIASRTIVTHARGGSPVIAARDTARG
jgi:hypothetical protein